MEFKGNLYAKSGNFYFSVEKTTDYVEKLEENNNKMLEMLKKTIPHLPYLGVLQYELKKLIEESTKIDEKKHLCSTCNLPTNGEKCYSKKCPI